MKNLLKIPYNLLPNYKKIKEKEKEQKNKIKEQKDIEKAFNMVFSSKEGICFGRWLIDQTCFLSSTLVMSKDNKLSEKAMAYNEGRRNLYLQIRELLTNETLLNLETKKEED